MLGAIAGDIIGSVFEANSIKTTEFQLFSDQSRFTDDSVLTCAVADWLIQKEDLVKILKKYTRKFPRAGYGENYFQWAMSGSREPYNSWGNGSAMRVSPVSFAFDNLDQ